MAGRGVTGGTPGAEGPYTAYSYLAAGEDFRRFEPVAYVDGMENPTENFPNICGWLVQHGFSDTEIRAIIGGNIYRVLQAVWPTP